MKKGLILALLAVSFVAAPAFASVQNIKVSGDVNSTWVVRDGWDLGARVAGADYYQNFIMTQSRLRVDADLTDKVGATVGLLNERAWGADTNDVNTTGTQTDSNNGPNDIDINLAYVTLKEMLYSPLTVIIGRQVFAYGNSFVIDATGQNNSTDSGGLDGVAEDMTLRTAQDAVRLVFDYNPLTVDVVASKISSNNLGGKGTQDDDVDLFGTNANWQAGDAWNSTVEGYFWAKIDNSAKSLNGGASPGSNFGQKADSVYMPGIHVSTNPIKGLNLQAEGAIQRGNKANTTALGRDNIKREAMGAQFIGNYMLPFESTAKWSPVVTGVYTYVSGDNDTSEPGLGTNGDHRYTAWDPMFENQGGGSIYNQLFSLSNARIVTAKASVKPIEDVTTTLQYDSIWLDKEITDGDPFDGNCTSCLSIQQPDGSTTAVRTTNNMKLGDEIGVGLVYDYTEDVQFGAKYSTFLPGGAFHKDNSENASQYIVNANVKF